jgi:hypothetical protein
MKNRVITPIMQIYAADGRWKQTLHHHRRQAAQVRPPAAIRRWTERLTGWKRTANLRKTKRGTDPINPIHERKFYEQAAI